MNGLAVLVLRYTRPGEREFQVPFNFTIRGVQIPVGLSLITLTLFLIAIVNLFTKPIATIAGGTFSILLFIGFTISERHTRVGGAGHVEMDQFNLESESELTPEAVGVSAGKYPCAGQQSLQSLSSGKCSGSRETGTARRRCAARSPVCGALPPANTSWRPISSSAASSSICSRRRSPLRKSAANRFGLRSLHRTISGMASCAPPPLQSSTIVLGHSPKESTEEQARHIGDAWEKLGDPKPQFNLEIHLAERRQGLQGTRAARAEPDRQRSESVAPAVAALQRVHCAAGTAPP